MTKLPYEHHPYADVFPLHEGPRLWEMSDHVKQHGLHEPIVLYQGKILDGRRRQLACIRAGVTPTYTKFTKSDPEALEFVVAKNLHRRHMAEGDRAMVAARIATLKQGQKSDRPIGLSENKEAATTTIGQAADMLNVSERTVKRAKVVVEHGTPELQAAVSAGTVSVSDAASVAKEPPEVQKEAVQKVASGKAKTVKAAAKPKNGAVRWDWKSFESAFGQLVREIDRHGNAYQCKESTDAKHLRALLTTFKSDFTAWHHKVSTRKESA